ncbi:hypothetical protein FGB62_14g024 [Gracilaria domingensis]|nr:hypothetical protein FGB62_14g024 [Gracilaria domingensis]
MQVGSASVPQRMSTTLSCSACKALLTSSSESRWGSRRPMKKGGGERGEQEANARTRPRRARRTFIPALLASQGDRASLVRLASGLCVEQNGFREWGGAAAARRSAASEALCAHERAQRGQVEDDEGGVRGGGRIEGAGVPVLAVEEVPAVRRQPQRLQQGNRQPHRAAGDFCHGEGRVGARTRAAAVIARGGALAVFAVSCAGPRSGAARLKDTW